MQDLKTLDVTSDNKLSPNSVCVLKELYHILEWVKLDISNLVYTLTVVSGMRYVQGHVTS